MDANAGETRMATITIEIDIDADGNVTVAPNPATVADGDTVRWHVARNEHGGGAVRVRLPAGAGSPFGNPDTALETGVERPRRCNLMEPATTPAEWPEGAESYAYEVDFSGSPVISSVRGTLLRQAAPEVRFPERLDQILEVYAVDGLPGAGGQDLARFRKVFPLPWWQRWWQCCWPSHRCGHGHHHRCCCCCCHGQGGQPAPSAGPSPAPTISLDLGMLAIGAQFYLLVTPQGQRCQFVVEWTASGGVGQLTVELEVQEAGAGAFRRLATGLGPTDSFVFTGARSRYLFRARVTDSRGASSFDTLSVTCP